MVIGKKCYKCGEEQIFENFIKSKSARDGYTNLCKKCCRIIEAGKRAKKRAEKEAEKQALIDRYYELTNTPNPNKK